MNCLPECHVVRRSSLDEDYSSFVSVLHIGILDLESSKVNEWMNERANAWSSWSWSKYKHELQWQSPQFCTIQQFKMSFSQRADDFHARLQMSSFMVQHKQRQGYHTEANPDQNLAQDAVVPCRYSLSLQHEIQNCEQDVLRHPLWDSWLKTHFSDLHTLQLVSMPWRSSSCDLLCPPPY